MEQKENKQRTREEKMVAPIIITVFLIMYYLGIVFLFLLLPQIPFLVKLLLSVIPLALAGVAFAMFWERICEIRSGEEDDLSKY